MSKTSTGESQGLGGRIVEAGLFGGVRWHHRPPTRDPDVMSRPSPTRPPANGA